MTGLHPRPLDDSGLVSCLLYFTCNSCLQALLSYLAGDSSGNWKLVRENDKCIGSVLEFPSVSSVQTRSPEGLTSVFEMGTGVSPPFWPPTIINSHDFFLKILVLECASKRSRKGVPPGRFELPTPPFLSTCWQSARVKTSTVLQRSALPLSYRGCCMHLDKIN